MTLYLNQDPSLTRIAIMGGAPIGAGGIYIGIYDSGAFNPLLLSRVYTNVNAVFCPPLAKKWGQKIFCSLGSQNLSPTFKTVAPPVIAINPYSRLNSMHRIRCSVTRPAQSCPWSLRWFCRNLTTATLLSAVPPVVYWTDYTASECSMQQPD